MLCSRHSAAQLLPPLAHALIVAACTYTKYCIVIVSMLEPQVLEAMLRPLCVVVEVIVQYTLPLLPLCVCVCVCADGGGLINYSNAAAASCFALHRRRSVKGAWTLCRRSRPSTQRPLRWEAGCGKCTADMQQASSRQQTCGPHSGSWQQPSSQHSTWKEVTGATSGPKEGSSSTARASCSVIPAAPHGS